MELGNGQALVLNPSPNVDSFNKMSLTNKTISLSEIQRGHYEIVENGPTHYTFYMPPPIELTVKIKIGD